MDPAHLARCALLNETQPLAEHQEEEEEEEEDFEADIDVRHEEVAIPTDAQRTNPERLTLTLNLRK